VRYVTETNSMADVSVAARNFFITLGVNLSPPKSIFFNDRLGVLFVRATEEDLETIENAVQTLNEVAPQVHIKSRFIEVEQDDAKGLGFDWYLGQFNLGHSIVGQGGQAGTFSVPVSSSNPSGTFPGNPFNGTTIPNSAQSLTSGLNNTINNISGSGTSPLPSLATLTGIMTDPNFQVVLHALEQRVGTEELAAPEVTTTSGRQTEMRATQVLTIVTGFSFQQNSTAASATGSGTTINNPGTAAITVNNQQVETGPLLDVVPDVLSDGYTINLTLIPSLTDFNGYDTPPSVPNVTAGLNVVQLPIILPHFTVRQVVTTVNIWDNQTVVIGGLVSSTVSSENDKVPMLGDLPLVGKLFQSSTKTSTKKNLMIFVTAMIVDPAGNRVHSDDELPFAQSPLPPQPPEAGQMTETVEPASLPPQ